MKLWVQFAEKLTRPAPRDGLRLTIDGLLVGGAAVGFLAVAGTWVYVMGAALALATLVACVDIAAAARAETQELDQRARQG